MSENLKLKKVNKSFVPEPKEGRQSVSSVFRIPMRMNILWTYVHFTYPYFGCIFGPILQRERERERERELEKSVRAARQDESPF